MNTPAPAVSTPPVPQNSVAELLEENYPRSLRLARSILRHETDAADAVQSAYSNVLRNLGGFRAESTFATWLNRIVVNQCLMRLRHLRRAPSISLEEIPTEPSRIMFQGSRLPSPYESLQQIEQAEAIRRALGELPDGLRRAFEMHELEGLSVRELSRNLGISVPAAKSRLFRARAELRDLLSMFKPQNRFPGAATA